MPDCHRGIRSVSGGAGETSPMLRAASAWTPGTWRPGRWAAILFATSLLAACGGNSPADIFCGTPPAAAPATTRRIRGGQGKGGLVPPPSAAGNAGGAGTSMRNAAEMALAEFNVADLQVLLKDDAGSAPGAQQAAQQALDEGAEVILGPIFAHSVSPVGQLARSRNVRVIAF